MGCAQHLQRAAFYVLQVLGVVGPGWLWAESVRADEAAQLEALAHELQTAIVSAVESPPVDVLVTAETPQKAPGLAEAVAAALDEQAGLRVVDAQARRAAVDEAALAAVAAGESSAEVLAEQSGASVMVFLESQQGDARSLVRARAVEVDSGAVLGTAEAEWDAGPRGEAAAGAPVAAALDARLRWLADQLVQQLGGANGDLRYRRLAVLRFSESGSAASENALGKLVAAELMTLLRRDHGLLLVERAEVNRLIDELALGQTGLTDPQQTVQVGQLSGAQMLIIGSVVDAGARYRVNARAIDAGSAKVLAAQKVSLPAADLVALSAEAVVLRTRSGAIYRSLLLPGWGQVYNREPVKAGLFAGLEGLSAGLAVFFHVWGQQGANAYSQLGAGTSAARFRELEERAELGFTLRNALLGATLGLHLLNVLDASLSGRTYERAEPR